MRVLIILDAVGNLIDLECLKKLYSSRVEVKESAMLITIYTNSSIMYFNRTIPEGVLNAPNLKKITEAINYVEATVDWITRDIYPILDIIGKHSDRE